MLSVDQTVPWFTAPLPRRSERPALGHRWPALSPAAAALERFVALLDSAVPIPGTRLRIGVDPLLGLAFPAVGDAISGAASLAILALAVQYRVPNLVVGRMVFNVAVDTAVGSIPVAGDIFDFVFKANEQNLRLLAEHRSDRPRRASLAQRLSITGLWLLGAACVAAPLALILLLL